LTAYLPAGRLRQRCINTATQPPAIDLRAIDPLLPSPEQLTHLSFAKACTTLPPLGMRPTEPREEETWNRKHTVLPALSSLSLAPCSLVVASAFGPAGQPTNQPAHVGRATNTTNGQERPDKRRPLSANLPQLYDGTHYNYTPCSMSNCNKC